MKNKENLLKHFASVLRNRANGNINPISLTLLKHLSRKDLVEVIKKVHHGSIPKQLDFALMENQELLEVIKDEMFIIAYITEKWSEEAQMTKELIKSVEEHKPQKAGNKKSTSARKGKK